MKTATRFAIIPENSVIASGFNKIDYCDTYRIVKATNDTAEELMAKVLKPKKPKKWINCLMGTRDFAVRIFGLKTSKNLIKEETMGFPIIEQHKNEIIVGEKDKHLDFRVSVLIDRENSFIYLTTIVCFNNSFGRLYFLLVKPFHKMIVKSVLRAI